MIEGAEIVGLTKEDIDYVRANLRAYDRKELEIMGYEKKPSRYYDHINSPYSMAGRIDGTPICCWGAVPTENCILFWFFGTDEVDQHWDMITPIAAAFMDVVSIDQFGRIPLVHVWEKHETSIRWLEKLGFEKTLHHLKLNNEKLIVMERTKRSEG